MEDINYERPRVAARRRRNSSTGWKRLRRFLWMEQFNPQKLVQTVQEACDRILPRFKGSSKEEMVKVVFDILQQEMTSVADAKHYPRAPKIFERKDIESALREVRSAIRDLHKIGLDDTGFLYDIQEALEARHTELSGKSPKSPSGVGFG